MQRPISCAILLTEDIDYAHVDHHRSLRKGFPEVIFGQGKTADQIIGIMDKMQDQENVILVTRIEQIKADKVVARFPDAVYHPDASMIVCELKKLGSLAGERLPSYQPAPRIYRWPRKRI